AAAGVADDQPVQPDRLPDQRLPLELLRRRRRRRAPEPIGRRAVLGRVSRHPVVDLSHRLPAAHLTGEAGGHAQTSLTFPKGWTTVVKGSTRGGVPMAKIGFV